MAMVFSNASPAMPPWGGKRRAARHQPVLRSARRPASIGRSCSTCRRRSRRAEKSAAPSAAARRIPLGYALDAQGRPTTDPKAALGGVVLPIGGYKGSGLVDADGHFRRRDLGRGFRRRGGRPVQGRSTARRTSATSSWRCKPDLFVSEDDYRARMDTLIERVRACPESRRIRRNSHSGRARGAARSRAPPPRHSLRPERGRNVAGRGNPRRRPSRWRCLSIRSAEQRDKAPSQDTTAGRDMLPAQRSPKRQPKVLKYKEHKEREAGENVQCRACMHSSSPVRLPWLR